jgi:hypothetical protein
VDVAAGAAIVLRKGGAAVGIRVLAARGRDGQPATVTLTDDGNTFGAMRLTIDHKAAASGAIPCVALWMRVSAGVRDDAALAAFRQAFAAAKGTADLMPDGANCKAAGLDGPLLVEATGGFTHVRIEPAPTLAVLERDGVDVGRDLLKAVAPFDKLPVPRTLADLVPPKERK